MRGFFVASDFAFGGSVAFAYFALRLVTDIDPWRLAAACLCGGLSVLLFVRALR
jgi:hypothetical protein